MAHYLAAGIDSNVLGPFTVTVGGAVGSGSPSLTGTFCHLSLAAITGSGQYTALASAVQTSLNTVGGGGFTVSWSTTTWLYTISNATSFTLTWTDNDLRNALGFSANVSATTSAVSTRRPYYLIVPTIGARATFTDVYEPDDIIQESVSDGGSPFAVAKQTSELWSDWSEPFEPKAAVLTRAATASVPWTYQQFFAHVRGSMPFACVDGSSSTVHKLRAEGGTFGSRVRERVVADYDDLWNIKFMTRDLGSL